MQSLQVKQRGTMAIQEEEDRNKSEQKRQNSKQQREKSENLFTFSLDELYFCVHNIVRRISPMNALPPIMNCTWLRRQANTPKTSNFEICAYGLSS